MGLFNSIARGLGSLGPLSDEELAEEREALRLRQCSGEDHYHELHRYDDEQRRRAIKADPAHSELPLPKREHGWYLPNDD